MSSTLLDYQPHRQLTDHPNASYGGLPRYLHRRPDVYDWDKLAPDQQIGRLAPMNAPGKLTPASPPVRLGTTAVGHVDSAESNHAKSQIKAARKRIKDKDFAGARSMLEILPTDGTSSAQRLLLIAKAYEGEDRYADAADYLRKAHAIGPDSTKIAVARLDMLTFLRNSRSAIQLYESLPKRTQRKRDIQREMHWLYRQLGWRAKAEKSYRPFALSWKQRILRALRRPLRRVFLKIENSERDDIIAQSDNLQLLDRMKYETPTQRYDVHAIVDDAIISSIRNNTILTILSGVLRVLFAITAMGALIFYLLVISKEGDAGPRLATGLICTILILYFGSKIWDAVPTYRGAFTMVSLFCVICVTTGTLTLRLVEGFEYLRLGGLAIICGAVILMVETVGNQLYVTFETYRRQRVTRKHARGAAIDRLADLIVDVDDIDSRSLTSYRRGWAWRLESVAQLLERDVAKQFLANDAHTTAWLNTQCAGAATSLRRMKLSILSPSGKSWEHLSRHLKQQQMALVTGNWHNLAVRAPAINPARTWNERLLSTVRLIAIALFPAVGLFAVSPWVDFGDTALRWTRAAAFGWATISILFALDPTLREKVQTARSIAGTVREIDEKTRRDGLDSSKRGESAVSSTLPRT